MKFGLLKHTDALNYILAGKSVTTFQNPETGKRFTFKVVKHKTDDIYFVNVLTGPENYTFIGIIQDQKYRHSKKSRIGQDAQSVKVFEWVIRHLVSGTLNKTIEIFHVGKCGRCGRQLTDPISIEIGLGPYCRKN